MFWRVEPHDHVMAKHIEDLGQFLQSFGVALAISVALTMAGALLAISMAHL